MAVAVSPRAHTAVAPLRGALPALAVCASAAAGLMLVADSAARALPATPWLDPVDGAFTAGAGLLAVAVCAAAWLTRRSSAGLLLAATLLPLLFALRIA